jgi:hypothetical protein
MPPDAAPNPQADADGLEAATDHAIAACDAHGQNRASIVLQVEIRATYPPGIDRGIEMPTDITYSIDAEAGETTFSANSPAGEEFLDGPELVVPNDEAKAYLEQAKAAGLTVVAFP